jgi:hypothetical protein
MAVSFRSLLRTHDSNGARSVNRYGLGYAAEQQAIESMFAMRTDNDQMCAPSLRSIEYDTARVTDWCQLAFGQF